MFVNLRCAMPKGAAAPLDSPDMEAIPSAPPCQIQQ